MPTAGDLDSDIMTGNRGTRRGLHGEGMRRRYAQMDARETKAQGWCSRRADVGRRKTAEDSMQHCKQRMRQEVAGNEQQEEGGGDDAEEASGESAEVTLRQTRGGGTDENATRQGDGKSRGNTMHSPAQQTETSAALSKSLVNSPSSGLTDFPSPLSIPTASPSPPHCIDSFHRYINVAPLGDLSRYPPTRVQSEGKDRVVRNPSPLVCL